MVQLQVLNVFVYKVLFDFALLFRLSNFVFQLLISGLQLLKSLGLVVVMKLLRGKQAPSLSFQKRIFSLELHDFKFVRVKLCVASK